MHHATPEGPSWQLIVPIKHAEAAKSRLVPPPPLSRQELARAMAADTLEAVCAALPPARVLVVTSDPSATAGAQSLGAPVLTDPGSGLNAALRAGAAWWRDRTDGPLGVLLGDLPALRPTDLLAALEACATHPRAVVPDREGSGTVLLTVTAGELEPRFGAGSAARHGLDASVLALDLPRLRTDVDDVTSLAEVAGLGVGRHTAAVLAAACLPAPLGGVDPPASVG